MNGRAGKMLTLQVFSRPGCHLCEQLVDELLPIVRGRLEVEVLDVDSRDDWKAAWGTLIPVICHEGLEICRHRLDREAIQRVLDTQMTTDRAF